MPLFDEPNAYLLCASLGAAELYNRSPEAPWVWLGLDEFSVLVSAGRVSVFGLYKTHRTVLIRTPKSH